MTPLDHDTAKKIVQRFDEDVRLTGHYGYITDRLSSRLANERISRGISSAYDFRGKAVLDIGSGDGTYAVELIDFGAARVLGLDPAPAAVENANKRAQAAGLGNIAQFEIGDIYDLGLQIADAAFDCVVFNKVLHHLPDPAGALNAAAHAARTVVIVEPNGYNPVLKLLERYSPYHVAHEERSFTPRQLQIWSEAAGFRVNSLQMINLVPMFCPDWLARLARRIEPLVERVPGLRTVICGQVVMVGCR